jgi:hypothetical protein
VVGGGALAVWWEALIVVEEPFVARRMESWPVALRCVGGALSVRVDCKGDEVARNGGGG